MIANLCPGACRSLGQQGERGPLAEIFASEAPSIRLSLMGTYRHVHDWSLPERADHHAAVSRDVVPSEARPISRDGVAASARKKARILAKTTEAEVAPCDGGGVLR